MTFDSSTETVAVLYDIENAPFEMLDFTLGKARKFFPCRMIVVSDWEKHPEQKRWNRLMARKGFTFRQIDRKIDGKNSLDYALFDMAKLLRDEGVRRFLIVTTDSDFVTIAQMLRESDTPCHIIGVGTEQASQSLRDAYDEFYCYPPMKKKKAKSEKKEEPEEKEKEKAGSKAEKKQQKKQSKKNQESLTKEEGASSVVGKNFLQVRLPKSLFDKLQKKKRHEDVDMDQLVTYLLMHGLSE